MSQVTTPHLGEKYEGIRPLWIDTEKIGRVRPSGMDKLKELYHELPNYRDGNEKIGLTDKGYAVYRNTHNDRIGYYYIVVRSDTVKCGRYWYPGQQYTPHIQPIEKYGEEWAISP